MSAHVPAAKAVSRPPLVLKDPKLEELLDASAAAAALVRSVLKSPDDCDCAVHDVLRRLDAAIAAMKGAR